MLEQETPILTDQIERSSQRYSESELASVAKGRLWKNEYKFFGQKDWRGGIGKQFTFDDVVSVLSGIESERILATKLTPNTNLAITQALKHAGVEEISDSMIADLRSEVRNETRRMYRVQNGRHPEAKAEKKGLQKSKRRRNWKFAAAPIIPVLALAAYAGRDLINSYSDSDVSDEQLESNSSVRLPSFLSNIGESIEEVVNRIPLVEELKEEDDDQYTRWGFIFALPEVKQGEEIDPSKFIIFEWESDKITQANGGILRADLYPQKDVDDRKFGWQCLNIPDRDCSKVVGNFIVVGGHSGVITNRKGEHIELAMEPLRAFIEGHKLEGGSTTYESTSQGGVETQVTVGGYSKILSKEEREQRIDLLEEERVTLNLWGRQAKAQVAVVRIQEVDRDKVYADWNRVIEIALKYDPELGERIDLQSGGVILAISGRRLPGDRLSGQNHYEYTSSLILIFIGEPAGS